MALLKDRVKTLQKEKVKLLKDLKEQRELALRLPARSNFVQGMRRGEG